MLVQIGPLHLLPHFHGADGEPEFGFHDMNRLTRGQGAHIVGDFIFAAFRDGQAGIEHILRKDVGAGIGQARAIEIGLFHEPLERSAATKLVRATRPLVLHEFRRYARVPLITDVSIVAGDATRILVSSQDISSGGMSLKGTSVLDPGQLVEVSFAMLTLPRIWLRGHITWKKANKTVGVRFDPNDERRRRLKEWLAGYLESS